MKKKTLHIHKQSEGKFLQNDNTSLNFLLEIPYPINLCSMAVTNFNTKF